MAAQLELFWSSMDAYQRMIGHLITGPSLFGIYLCVILAYLLTTTTHELAHVLISAMLALAWFWLGGIFWLSQVSGYLVATVWGLLFLLQGYLLLVYGVLSPRLIFRSSSRIRQWSAAACLAAALLLYPLLAAYGSRLAPQFALVGLVPGPTVLLTMAFLLLLPQPAPLGVAVIPMAWAVAGLFWLPLNPPGDGLVLLAALGVTISALAGHWRTRRARRTGVTASTAVPRPPLANPRLES